MPVLVVLSSVPVLWFLLMDFPRILFSHQMKKDKAKYFGPYTSAGAVKDTIELLRKLYDIRSCNKSLPKEIGKDVKANFKNGILTITFPKKSTASRSKRRSVF